MNGIPTLTINPEKEEFIRYGEEVYACYAIRTELILAGANLTRLVEQYAEPLLQPGDFLLLSEKMVACAQGRGKPIAEIKAGTAARLLCRFVHKTDYGIGLSMPETMQCAIDECGLPRILLAAAAGAVGRLLGKSGWFYHVAGYKAAAVDGPCHFTIPPYDKYVVPAPDSPRKVVRELARMLDGVTVLLIDCNDIGGKILASSGLKSDFPKILALLQQNPLGQSREQTPMGILRKVSTPNSKKGG